MDSTALKHIGEELFKADAARKQITNPSTLHPDITFDDAYKIADSMVKCYVENGFKLAGNKIGFTIQSLWESAGVTEPSMGYLFSQRIFVDPKELPFDSFIQPRVETEIVFVLKSDLNGKEIDAQSVLDATDYIVAAFEIVDSRIVPSGKNTVDVFADNASFGACLLGTRRLDPKTTDPGDETVEVYKNGQFLSKGSFSDVLGSPVNSMVWLANKLSRAGRPLKAGDIILTGSCFSPFDARKDDTFLLKYSTLGELAVSFR